MSQLTIRQLSIGEILDLSFTIYRGNFATLFLIALFTSGIPLVLNIYLTARGGLLAAPVVALIYLVLAVAMGAMATAATTFVVSEAYLGRPLGAADALSRAVPLLGQVIVLTIVFGFLVGLGLLFLIIPGIIIGCGLAVSTPALVLESRDAMKALSRSWGLTRGFRGKMFVLLLVVGIIIYLPSFGIGVLAVVVGGVTRGLGEVSFGLIAVTVLAGLVQMLVYPILYCALTVAYYDLRVRKEGFDLELLETGLHTA